MCISWSCINPAHHFRHKRPPIYTHPRHLVRIHALDVVPAVTPSSLIFPSPATPPPSGLLPLGAQRPAHVGFCSHGGFFTCDDVIIHDGRSRSPQRPTDGIRGRARRIHHCARLQETFAMYFRVSLERNTISLTIGFFSSALTGMPKTSRSFRT